MVSGRGVGTLSLVAAVAVGTLLWGSSTSVAAATPATQQLKGGLLTVKNLPPGWSKTTASSPTTSSCFSNPIWKVVTTAKAQAAFQMNNSVPQLVEELGSYRNAHTAYQQVVANLNRCLTFSETIKGQKVSGTVSPVSDKRFGNESSSYTANLTVQGTSIGQEFVIVRKGGTLAAVAVSDYGNVDAQLLNGFATTAIRNISA
jgi:hypothetical protein